MYKHMFFNSKTYMNIFYNMYTFSFKYTYIYNLLNYKYKNKYENIKK